MKQNFLDNTKAESSKILIMDALYLLIKKKPLQEISITEIAETAGVSRLSFYRNFENKENVVFAYCDRIRKNFYNMISAMEEKPDLPFILNCCFSIREAEREACMPIYRDSLLLPAFNRSWNLAMEETSDFSHLSYTRKRIVIGGMYSILIDWIEGKNKFDKAEAIEIIMEMVSGKEKAKDAREHSLAGNLEQK